MVKFDARSDQGYLNVRKHIPQLARDAPEVIRDQFAKDQLAPKAGIVNAHDESILQTQRKVEDIFTSVQDITDNKRLDILNWLSDVSFKKHHGFYKSLCIKGSGRWLLAKNSFRNWNDSDVSALLWLRGSAELAGTGKTTLASKLIDDTKLGPRCALAYFYCNYKEDQRGDPASILRSLVKQLCLMSQSGFPEPVLSIYKKRKSDADLTNLLSIAECKELLITLSTGFLWTKIIIDVLDECDPDTCWSLCDVLEQTVSSKTTKTPNQNPVKVFITSRNDGDLRRRFEDDIKLYIKTEIKACIGRKELLDGVVGLQLKRRIVRALETGACGMFIWVKFQIERICSEIVEGGVEEALTELPKGLNEMYSEMLQKIRTNKSHRTSTIVRMALKFVLCAVRPPSPKELVEAIRFTPMLCKSASASSWDGLTLAAVLGVCQNLLILDDRLGVVRFAHFSVQEFLLTQFSSEEVHTCLAEICLTILLAPGAHGDDKSAALAMTDYATINWPEHLRLSSSTGSSSLVGLWQQFLTPSSSGLYEKWASKIPVPTYQPLLGILDQLHPTKSTVIAPLLVACFYQLADVVRWLLHTEPNMASANHRGSTSLHYTSMNGNHHILRLLLERDGVDVNSKDSEYGQTSLSWAARIGREKVVQMLLEKAEVDVDSRDSKGRTPLYWAVRVGREKVVQMLLERDGVDVDSRDSEGRTPLSWAAENEHENVVQMLLEKDGVDLNSNDNEYDQTPLSWAAENGHEKVVQMLLKKDGVDLNSKDKWGQTPLSKAALNGYEKVVQMLLEKHGVDLNSNDSEYDQTPLSWAAENGHEKVVQMLLEKDGVDVDSRDRKYDQTPLSWAARNGCEKVVQMLLKKDGVDVGSRDIKGRTPLSWAAENGHEKVVQMLRGKGGVDLNSKDSEYGQTPLFQARKIILSKRGVRR
ncbi:hypothetical protein Q9L58_009682 [Maublancomyces gigas]|uniref:Nephrocystin 3-like N-terminal domain-containing protein n=1 Tax=Discina gigas TaxID=1032678 RepID=A0ABR3G6Q1_9PEZI